MAGRVTMGLLACLGIAMLSPEVWAGESREPERGNRDVPFQRLDRNHDGVVTADEIPPAAPEPLKARLRALDKNNDGKITADEFKEGAEAMKRAGRAVPPQQPGGPGAAPPRVPGTVPPLPPPGPGARQERPRRGPEAASPKPSERRPASPGRPQPPRPGTERGRIPDPKTLFAMMDKNHDGALSLDEFSAGMKEVHGRMAERFRSASAERPWQMGPGPGRGPGPQFGPGAAFGMGRGQGMARGYGMGWHQMGGPPAMAWWRGPMGGPNEEHLRKLVAKLVREEVAKVLREQGGPGSRPRAEPVPPRPPRHDSKPDARSDRGPRDPRP